MTTKIFFTILVSITSLNAALIKHDVSRPRYHDFPFKEVCTELGSKNLELIEEKSVMEIDCMGKVFQAMDFCLKKFPLEKTLTRAIVDGKTKNIRCEMSESVMLSVSCDQRDSRYCLDPQKGCEELKKIYGHKLDVAHFSLLEKNINCYFAKPLGESLNENP